MIHTTRFYQFTLLLIITLLGSACGINRTTKEQEFPLMYQEKPASILILPPMNNSTAADAKEYYSTTIQEPLSLTGYYTYPYELTAEILKMEGIYDTELLQNMPVAKFREYFGADAVLFTTIKKWDTSYTVLASNMTISIDCVLKSTRSEQVLWKYNGTIKVDLSGGNSGGGIPGLIIKIVATAVKTAITDYVPYARKVNFLALASMPYGKYHPKFNQDQSEKILDQTPRANN
jgi:hypothetical protein